VLEPDGRHGRQILISDDGLKEPRGIYFNKSKNCLLVTNYHGPSFNSQELVLRSRINFSDIFFHM
jgi:hypothetical protein